MKRILILLVIVASTFGVNAQEVKGITLLNVKDFKAQIETKDVQLIDVRTPEEYQKNHINEAVNIDFYSEDFEKQFSELDKNKPLYLYCRSGYRSNQSALKLLKMGFSEIYDLEGGILNYNKN